MGDLGDGDGARISGQPASGIKQIVGSMALRRPIVAFRVGLAPPQEMHVDNACKASHPLPLSSGAFAQSESAFITL